MNTNKQTRKVLLAEDVIGNLANDDPAEYDRVMDASYAEVLKWYEVGDAADEEEEGL